MERLLQPLIRCYGHSDLFYRDVELFERQAISDEVSCSSQMLVSLCLTSLASKIADTLIASAGLRRLDFGLVRSRFKLARI